MASKVFNIPCLLVALFLIQSAAACSSCDTNNAPKDLVMTHQIISSSGQCSVDPLKLGACIDLLHGLLHLVVSHHSSGSHCCPLVKGLADLEAAACLCNAVKADVLGINVGLDAKLNLLADACGRKIPEGYSCQ
ncbi:pEARLI1-like lipid transfer protein 2 [Nymphaea thermarum]|nr:pEARLI1-like lipid transfer protein 2 [Nymphaea thermarum]